MTDLDALYEIADTGGGTTRLLFKTYAPMRNHRSMQTHCKRGHAYTEDNIRFQKVRGRYKVRKCMACRRLRYHEKKGTKT